MASNESSKGQPTLAVLCSRCEGILHSNHAETWFAKWHLLCSDRNALDASAKAGCALCARIAAHVPNRLGWAANIPSSDPEVAQLRGICLRIDLDTNLEIRFQVGWGGGLIVQEFIDLILVYEPDRSDGARKEVEVGDGESDVSDSDEDTVSSTMTKSKLADSTLSSGTWDLAKRWLQTCQSNHAECNRISDPSFVPKRLVLVKGKTSSLSLRLCEQPDLPAADVEYITLSHCWGPNPIFCLTQENQNALTESIPLAEISTVFKDAALAASKLGFQYMWIDSLCIIQNSKSDWEEQSSQMGQIYKNAALNIAGTGFVDGESGFFASRNPDDLFPLELNIKWEGVWSHLDRPRAGRYFLLDDNVFRHEVEEAPLNRRGWVVQERLLSPRILHFGRTQVFWECFEDTCSEVFPDGGTASTGIYGLLKHSLDDLPFFSSSAGRQRSSRGLLDLFVPSPSKEVKRKAYEAWLLIVETYTLGALTCTEDKLPAISGIAKYMQAILRDEYLAGMWKGNLRRELLWSLSSSRKAQVAYPLRYRAPTWSWASIDGAIDFSKTAEVRDDENEQMFAAKRFHCTILDVAVTSSTADATGPVRGGHLKVIGPLFAARESAKGWVVEDQVIDMRMSLDYMANTIGDNYLTTLKLALPRADALNVFVSDDYDDKVTQEARLNLLTVLSDWDTRENCSYTAGLILIPLGGRRGQYTRTGMFYCIDEKSEFLHSNPRSLPEARYEQSHEDGRYTITIF